MASLSLGRPYRKSEQWRKRVCIIFQYSLSPSLPLLICITQRSTFCLVNHLSTVYLLANYLACIGRFICPWSLANCHWNFPLSLAFCTLPQPEKCTLSCLLIGCHLTAQLAFLAIKRLHINLDPAGQGMAWAQACLLNIRLAKFIASFGITTCQRKYQHKIPVPSQRLACCTVRSKGNSEPPLLKALPCGANFCFEKLHLSVS